MLKQSACQSTARNLLELHSKPTMSHEWMLDNVCRTERSLKFTDRAALMAADFVYRRPFLAAAREPRRVQDFALQRIVRTNSRTEFGQEHGFERLSSRDAYRAAVPIQTHDSLADSIGRQARTGVEALTAEQPIFYARTSGTTGPARDFPVTASTQKAQRSAQRVLSATLYRDTGFFEGRIAGFAGAHVEGHLSSGQPYGSASGHTYATAPRFVKRKFVMPKEVFDIRDPDEKYFNYALAILKADDLTGIVTANPSTLLSVFTQIRQNAEALLQNMAENSWPDRARQLERILATDVPLGALWPRLNTLATWTGGNCSVALDQVLSILSARVKVVEIGYRASEFIGTINVDAAANLCLPDLRNTVFEFAEEASWESGDVDFRWLDELSIGRRYYVFATTTSGLYRYDINDIVEVTGRIGDCPILNFIRKGQGSTSITGEKLHETQVIAAVKAADLAPGYFVAVTDAARAVYCLFYETA